MSENVRLKTNKILWLFQDIATTSKLNHLYEQNGLITKNNNYYCYMICI